MTSACCAFAGPTRANSCRDSCPTTSRRWRRGTLLRAGLHSPQGRTLALLALAAMGADEVLAMLPRELLASVAATLKRYVLRAKVKISDASGEYSIYGVSGAGRWQRASRSARLSECSQRLCAGAGAADRCRRQMPAPAGEAIDAQRLASARYRRPVCRRSTPRPRASSSRRCSISTASMRSPSPRAATPARK